MLFASPLREPVARTPYTISQSVSRMIDVLNDGSPAFISQRIEEIRSDHPKRWAEVFFDAAAESTWTTPNRFLKDSIQSYGWLTEQLFADPDIRSAYMPGVDEVFKFATEVLGLSFRRQNFESRVMQRLALQGDIFDCYGDSRFRFRTKDVFVERITVSARWIACLYLTDVMYRQRHRLRFLADTSLSDFTVAARENAARIISKGLQDGKAFDEIYNDLEQKFGRRF
jgi:hypothetical protein